jgi:glucuronide carrier protein
VAAQWGIRAGVGLIPAVFALLAILVMVAYPLTDKRHAEIVAEIAARREAADEPEPIEPDLTTAAMRSLDGTGPARAR